MWFIKGQGYIYEKLKSNPYVSMEQLLHKYHPIKYFWIFFKIHAAYVNGLDAESYSSVMLQQHFGYMVYKHHLL